MTTSMTTKALLITMIVAICSACSPSGEESSAPESMESIVKPGNASVSEEAFGTTQAGESVSLYTLTNVNGMSARITSYGGRITSLTAPDRNGVYEDVVLGFDTLAEYEADPSFFGAVIGRYANRIAEGRFNVFGQDYQLTVNDGSHHLHGGERGFYRVVWSAEPFSNLHGVGLRLSYVSPDGEEGYPGQLNVTVQYLLTNANSLVINYEATTSLPTPVNLTHHSYFNLSGNSQTDILGHELMINAGHITPVGVTLIPTGEIRPVAGTPFDFRSVKTIGQDIEADDEQIRYGRGYDHNFVVDRDAAGEEDLVARLHDPGSGRYMEVHSDEPGLQLYSGNSLEGTLNARGVAFGNRSGLCLESQHFPNSPNQPAFPPTVLYPGGTYRSWTSYTFGAED